jgi:hypothetical protein
MAFDEIQLFLDLSGSVSASPQVLAMLVVLKLKVGGRMYRGYKVVDLV